MTIAAVAAARPDRRARRLSDLSLSSPKSGRPLDADTPHSVACDGERWPVIDGIPYLRVGSEALASAALDLLDDGRADEATAVLLAENDPWWDEKPPPRDRLMAVVRDRDRLSLRDAMAGLGWGRVGDYFAHRWSDPTFLAGLTILDNHWADPGDAFEIACGIGHYLRALSKAGVDRVVGGDIVFGKLWVCRHWVCPEAGLVCFDAEADRWPVDAAADLVTCHDAFYFFENKARIAGRIKAGARRVYAVPHIHNAAADNHSAGAATTAAILRDLFPEAVFYDDDELTRAGAAGAAPKPGVPGGVAAMSLVGGELGDASPARILTCPPDGVPLVRNPLLTDGGKIDWPSDRYRAEYASAATYGRADAVPRQARMGPAVEPFVRTRDLLDLPARW